MTKLNVLMTVYNEADFVEYAIKACASNVKNLVIVEGAYQETIKAGGSPRSTDDTSAIIEACDAAWAGKVHLLRANEKSDPQQRNVGLAKIKQLDPTGWLLIIDGDEVYHHMTFRMIEALTNKMEANNQLAAYFKSLTFVNDFQHYCEQEFPRLFKLTPACQFVDDNFMSWPDMGLGWSAPHVIKASNVEFFHYSFCKSHDRFLQKKKWWETRFQRPFEYSWHIDDSGKISDSQHKIYEFHGKHPDIMKTHPLRQK
jgi:glycosyltransferase involved in cell wall biosynthesis